MKAYKSLFKESLAVPKYPREDYKFREEAVHILVGYSVLIARFGQGFGDGVTGISVR